MWGRKKMQKTQTAGDMPALRHGLRSSVALISGEDPGEFEILRDGMVDELRPVGMLEHELVERVVSCTWRLRRIGLLEAEALDELAERAYQSRIVRLSRVRLIPFADEGTDHGQPELPMAPGVGRARRPENSIGRALADESADRALNVLRRYESSLDRNLASALAQLERVQAGRKRDAGAEGKDCKDSEGCKGCRDAPAMNGKDCKDSGGCKGRPDAPAMNGEDCKDSEGCKGRPDAPAMTGRDCEGSEGCKGRPDPDHGVRVLNAPAKAAVEPAATSPKAHSCLLQPTSKVFNWDDV